MDPSSEVVRQLINFGCDVNISDNLQMTPIYKVTAMQFIPKRYLDGQYVGETEKYLIDEQDENEKQIMKILINAGANVNISDIFGRTPLFLANDINVIRTLINCGADLNITDKCGRSLLLSALTMPNNDYIARFYISRTNSSQIHMPDMYGSTPLHYAAILSRRDIFDLFIGAGASVNTKDKDGNTPLEIIQSRMPHQTVLYDRKEYYDQGRDDLKKIEIVHFADVIRREDISDVVYRPPDASKMVEDLNQPGLGAPWYKKESDLIKATVVDLAKHICHCFGQVDSRFKCTLFRTGSTAEGTKVGEYNEFDFVFCLKEFADLCLVTEVHHKRGFAELQPVGDIPEIYRKFFDNNLKCNVTQIRSVFSKLLKRIVLDQSTWTNPHLFFNGDVKHLEEFDRPVFTLKLRWTGYMYKDNEISLDIVPAVRKIGWWPSDTDLQNLEMVTDEIRNEGCILLLQNPSLHSDTLLRISCSPAEIRLMKSLPSYVLESYRLCKLLRHRSVCPLMYPDSPSDQFPILKADKYIASYMLKNCLFHAVSDCKKENILRTVDASTENQAVIGMAIRILKHIDRCIVLEKLPLYFIPKREDLFTFRWVELNNLDETSVKNLNHFHCARRRAFLKIMLYILGERLGE